jgi:hypothetical protein
MPAMKAGAWLMGSPQWSLAATAQSSNTPKSLPPELTTNRERASRSSSPATPAWTILALVFLNSWTCSRRLIVPFPCKQARKPRSVLDFSLFAERRRKHGWILTVASRMPDPPEA